MEFQNLMEMLSMTLMCKKVSAKFVITAWYMALLCTSFGTVTTVMISFSIIT
jgi:hypothetical protein